MANGDDDRKIAEEINGPDSKGEGENGNGNEQADDVSMSGIEDDEKVAEQINGGAKVKGNGEEKSNGLKEGEKNAFDEASDWLPSEV